MATTAAPTVLHLSLVVGGDLRDGSGERLGRVDDPIVHLGDEDYPPVTGVVATVAGRPGFVAAEQTVELGPGFVKLIGQQLDLQHFQRAPAGGAAEEGRPRPAADQRRRRPGSCVRTRSSSRGSRAGTAWSASTSACAGSCGA
jgi:hypothetical protein